jgi:CheY-like chemotaxis protein
MGVLDDFRSKDFLDQVAVLAELENQGRADAVPELLELYREPVGDTAVDNMVRNTLRALLLADPEQTLAGLEHEDPEVRAFCAMIAGETGLERAAPALRRMAEDAAGDSGLLMDALAALAGIGDSGSLPLFRSHAADEDALVAGVCLQALGELGDAESLPLLRRELDDAESQTRYETCEVSTWKAVEALGELGRQGHGEAVAALAAKLHHRNPTARRLVHKALVGLGPAAVPHLEAAFRDGDDDQRVMAANVLGFIGDRKGADVLIQGLDEGLAEHPNVRFAAYEALGRIPSMKSLVCLMDGLPGEEDPSVLMALLTALDAQMNPGVAGRLPGVVSAVRQERPETFAALLRAVAAARATQVFAALYADEALADALMERIVGSGDPEAVAAFAEKLESMEGDRAATDLAELRTVAEEAPGGERGSLLAIDDSEAMLGFYRSAGSEMGFAVETAANGKDAYDLLELGMSFDVIVVDMNMPVMDGIEFTTKARALPGHEDTPIIMATTESEKHQAQLARKAGVSSFLKKPFTIDILQNKINKVLG